MEPLGSDQVFDSWETGRFGGRSYVIPTMGIVSVDQSSSWVPPGPTTPFSTGDAGKTQGVSLSEAGSLQPRGTVSMNGSTDLSSVVVGTGDRYAWGIWKSERLQHTVADNSSDPGIVKIEWGS